MFIYLYTRICRNVFIIITHIHTHNRLTPFLGCRAVYNYLTTAHYMHKGQLILCKVSNGA